MHEATCKHAKGCALDPCPVAMDIPCQDFEESALFVPLMTEHYRRFDDGTKDTEYRPYGPRWNEATCRIGRPVVLSRGYSTPDRMRCTVAKFQVIDSADAPPAYHAIYGAKHAGKPVAAIKICRSGEAPAQRGEG